MKHKKSLAVAGFWAWGFGHTVAGHDILYAMR